MTSVGTAPPQVLTGRQLNRATLARQMLLGRSPTPVADAVAGLAGLQAQDPQAPYVGLWSRLDGFDPAEASLLLGDRARVRIAVMRGTVHLLTADDCLAWRPLLQPLFDRALRGDAQHAAGLAGVDLQALAATAAPLLAARPRTNAELGAALGEVWPDRDPGALVQGVRGVLPLVQVPPRGLWQQSGQPVSTTADAWLGRPLDRAPSIDTLVVRYLAAFGPATVADVQAWSGLTRLREVVERLRPGLRTFRDERGRELFDLPDAPRPSVDTPAPPRFLPRFDNLLVAHADRRRVISEGSRARLWRANGAVPGTVLVDGVVAAAWRLAVRGGTATLTVEPFDDLGPDDRRAVEAEGARLLAFASPRATAAGVAFGPLAG